MMIELLDLINKEKMNGYNDVNASAKVCQDLVLKAIANGPMCKNVTIKGGVVMRSKTNNIRRATQDIDMDFGVHKNLEIKQETYCFDISFTEDGASLLINTNEQMVTEKLRSLLKFGPASTRYKDVFDMFYLIGQL